MFDFLQQNLMLIAVIVIATVALILPMINARRYAPELTPKKAIEMMNSRKAQVVDIRQSEDFKRGHVAGSLNYPVEKIQGMLNKLDRKRPVILIDQTGVGSRPVAKQMRVAGFEEVYILEAGLIGWFKEKLPLE